MEGCCRCGAGVALLRCCRLPHSPLPPHRLSTPRSLQHCQRHALHPGDPAARQQHLDECRQRHERLAARARSAAVECGICLEPVLSKAAPGDRKFGLLPACSHPFCLRCIRDWRQKTDAGADLDTVRGRAWEGGGWRACAASLRARVGMMRARASVSDCRLLLLDLPTFLGLPQALRTCPVCRVGSHYIVPSLVWPESAEEKEHILAGTGRRRRHCVEVCHFVAVQLVLLSCTAARRHRLYCCSTALYSCRLPRQAGHHRLPLLLLRRCHLPLWHQASSGSCVLFLLHDKLATSFCSHAADSTLTRLLFV